MKKNSLFKTMIIGALFTGIFAMSSYAGTLQELKEAWTSSVEKFSSDTLYSYLSSAYDAASDVSANIDEASKKQFLIDSINAIRNHDGLGELEVDDSLMKAAQKRAEELSESFTEDRPDGSDVSSLLEGVQEGAVKDIYGTSKTAIQMAGRWFNSDLKQKILGADDKKLGVGSYTKDDKTYWSLLITD